MTKRCDTCLKFRDKLTPVKRLKCVQNVCNDCLRTEEIEKTGSETRIKVPPKYPRPTPFSLSIKKGT